MGNDSATKSKPKDSQLLIRINKEERDRFLALCDEHDTTAAQEIRRFIKKFMAKKSRH